LNFSKAEKAKLLELKGVGHTVILRLEQLGFSNLSQLASEDSKRITKDISLMIGSTCWHNSPMAQQSIRTIIELAKKELL
jgi:hypothetical protein